MKGQMLWRAYVRLAVDAPIKNELTGACSRGILCSRYMKSIGQKRRQNAVQR